jgi:sugar phosphate isomerase/epimerase
VREPGCRTRARQSFDRGRHPGPAGRAEATRLLADSLHQVCEHGRRFGVALTLETFDRDADKHALLGPATEAAEFSALMRKDYADFGIMYDLSHQPLLGEQVLPALHALKDHLVHAHVGNCVTVPGREAFGDTHPRFGFPGSANDVNELVEFLSALFEIGYLKEGASTKPWVGIEVKPQAGETTPELLTCTKQAWTEAWARLDLNRSN